jgi:hypothetical protein
MTISTNHNIRIEYESNQGTILASWKSNQPAKVEFLNNPGLSFEIQTRILGIPFSLVEPTAKGLHREVFLELLLRVPGIELRGASHLTESSGSLDLLLEPLSDEFEPSDI